MPLTQTQPRPSGPSNLNEVQSFCRRFLEVENIPKDFVSFLEHAGQMFLRRRIWAVTGVT